MLKASGEIQIKTDKKYVQHNLQLKPKNKGKGTELEKNTSIQRRSAAQEVTKQQQNLNIEMRGKLKINGKVKARNILGR